MPPRDRTKRRVTPKQDRARASSDAILTAAEILLREQGYARLTTNRVAARAGVNIALVYRYFAGKEALVGALIERVAVITYAAVQKVLSDHAQSPLPVALRALLEVLVTTPSSASLHRELVENVDIAKRRNHVQELRASIAALVAAFLGERQAELRPLPDSEASLFVMQYALEAATHAASFYRPAGLSMNRVLDALTELVLHGLGVPADR